MRYTLDDLTNPNCWAVWGHRISRRLWLRGWRFVAVLAQRANRIVTGVDIEPQADIGKPFLVGHGLGTVIGWCRIGDNCTVMQGCTLGLLRLDDLTPTPDDYPRLGNRVFIGAHAVLLGPITIGDDAVVGAGAVVLCDVPAGCTAVGNPARILPPKAERLNTARAHSR